MVCALSHTTVDGPYRRNLVDIALYEVRKLVEQPTPLVAGCLGSPRCPERRFSCIYSSIHVLRGSSGNLGDQTTIG